AKAIPSGGVSEVSPTSGWLSGDWSAAHNNPPSPAMNARRTQFAKSTAARRQAKGRNTFVRSHGHKRRPKQARRAGMQQQTICEPFAPPEDWYEPTGRTNYKIVVQEPGEGYRHVLTPDQIRARLAQVPQKFLEQLEVVQLSRMTRKKQSFPCYGM